LDKLTVEHIEQLYGSLSRRGKSPAVIQHLRRTLRVFERTRELGMMRAIGMTRRQTRRMIRHESVVTALIGAALGIVLGLILAGLLSARLAFIEFVLPVPQLITFAAIAVIVGVFAAVFPARRAARLDPLQALQYE
jgi:putative ABC transport system permease protein